MHNLAIALHKKGYQVTGSDDNIFEPSKSRLEKHGLCPPEFGWNEAHISSEIDEVILGMHAKPDNIELKKAQELGLQIYSFPEYIYKESKNKQRIAICGSHGKTTITSMVMHVLKSLGKNFDYAVGAQLEGFDTMVKITEDAPYIIIEGDEYLSSPIDLTPKFFRYQHHICSISGIAWDHINVFPTFDNYKQQFIDLCKSTPRSGTIIYNGEDQLVKEIAEDTTGDFHKTEYRSLKHKNNKGVTTIEINGEKQELQIFGDHNMSNLSCAYEICKRLSVKDSEFLEAIKSYTGANKRLTLKGKNETCNAYLDFAHAPSKLVATVSAVKKQFEDRKLTAVIELHTFSSLNADFIVQYKDKLKAADYPIVFIDPNVLAKKGISELTERQIKSYFNDERIIYIQSKTKLEETLLAQDWKNHNLLLMSSGNFGGLDIDSLIKEII